MQLKYRDYELYSSRQQAVRLQVTLTTVLSFATGLSLKSAACS
ncbi:hypothetical protein [Pseudoalteromonas sp. SR43-7]|nr:hypothetical protein [Pseudoalteromonas sp. SR43-7]